MKVARRRCTPRQPRPTRRLLPWTRGVGCLKGAASRVPSKTLFTEARVSQNFLARHYLRALEKAKKNEAEAEYVPSDDENAINLADAATYAQIRARLERVGKPTGPLDTQIAAQTAARKLTLSNNRKEVGRVSRLAIE